MGWSLWSIVDGTLIEGVLADNFTLTSGGDVSNSNRATIAVTLLGDITSSGNIVLGDPNNEAVSVDFGQVSLTAVNADLTEGSETRLAGLDIDPGWLPWIGRVVSFHYDHSQVRDHRRAGMSGQEVRDEG